MTNIAPCCFRAGGWPRPEYYWVRECLGPPGVSALDAPWAGQLCSGGTPDEKGATCLALL